jgi:hypothetical protein
MSLICLYFSFFYPLPLNFVVNFFHCLFLMTVCQCIECWWRPSLSCTEVVSCNSTVCSFVHFLWYIFEYFSIIALRNRICYTVEALWMSSDIATVQQFIVSTHTHTNISNCILYMLVCSFISSLSWPWIFAASIEHFMLRMWIYKKHLTWQVVASPYLDIFGCFSCPELCMICSFTWIHVYHTK